MNIQTPGMLFGATPGLFGNQVSDCTVRLQYPSDFTAAHNQANAYQNAHQGLNSLQNAAAASGVYNSAGLANSLNVLHGYQYLRPE